MAAPLKILKVNHINQIVDDYAGAVGHLEDFFGGQVLMDIGSNPLTAGCLMEVGGEIVELLVPKVLDRAEGKQLARYGPHYQGIEVLVPSLPESLQAVRERGIEILFERSTDFFTKPTSTLGVCLQVSAGDWHADPPPVAYVNPLRPARWWREHPIGYRGLHHVSLACQDLVEAERFWCELTGGMVTHRAEWPAADARAVGLDIGIPVELVAPTGPGLIQEYLDRYGPRLRATTFAVGDLAATEAHFASRGIELVPGDAPGSMMVPPESNYHVVYQFME